MDSPPGHACAALSGGRADAKVKAAKFGRKPNLTPHQRREAIKHCDADGESLRSIARSYNVSASTIFEAAAMTRTTIAQIGAAALFLVIVGGLAVSRVLATDPVGPDGHKSIFPYYIGDVRIPENQDAILESVLKITDGRFCG